MAATPPTDFAGYSHAALVTMLYDSDPDVAATTADTWSSIGSALHDQAGALEHTLQSFDGIWQGDAATAYHAMIADLASGIRQTATSALAIRDLVHHATDALRSARAAMPAPVELTSLAVPAAPAVFAALTSAPGPSLAGGTAPPQAPPAALAQIQQQQQLLASAATAHAQAVVVMTDLARTDAAVDAALPPAPAATVPTVAADGSVQPNATGAAVNATGAGPTPLFSQVFRAGLVAARVAAGGQFGPAPVKLASAPAPPAAATSRPPKLAGVGTGGSQPAASAALATSAGDPIASGLPASTGAPAATTSGTGYMPPMGYGMGGTDDGMGGGRRIPPWLVETEDVWGESSAVTPGVIGEETFDTAGRFPIR